MYPNLFNHFPLDGQVASLPFTTISQSAGADLLVRAN